LEETNSHALHERAIASVGIDNRLVPPHLPDLVDEAGVRL